MNENTKAFLDAIQSNEELKEKVAEIDKKAEEEPENYIDEYIALAKEYGVSLTKEDFVPDQPDSSEMTDDELQAVTGGEDVENLGCYGTGKEVFGSSYQKGDCYCFVVGAVKGCGCVVLGTNELHGE